MDADVIWSGPLLNDRTVGGVGREVQGIFTGDILRVCLGLIEQAILEVAKSQGVQSLVLKMRVKYARILPLELDDQQVRQRSFHRIDHEFGPHIEIADKPFQFK